MICGGWEFWYGAEVVVEGVRDLKCGGWDFRVVGWLMVVVVVCINVL